MNSSVTWDSDTSVTSSCRRLIRVSSRSNGPSKLSSRTLKTLAAPSEEAAAGGSATSSAIATSSSAEAHRAGQSVVAAAAATPAKSWSVFLRSDFVG